MTENEYDTPKVARADNIKASKYGEVPLIEFPALPINADKRQIAEFIANHNAILLSALFNKEGEDPSDAEKIVSEFFKNGIFESEDVDYVHHYFCESRMHMIMIAVQDYLNDHQNEHLDWTETMFTKRYNSPKMKFEGNILTASFRNKIIRDGATYVLGSYICKDGGFILQIWYEEGKGDPSLILDEILGYCGKNSIWDNVIRITGDNGIPLSFLKCHDVNIDDVFCPTETKDAIFDNTIYYLKNKEELCRRGIDNGRKVLLHGQPGNGKSLLMKAIIKQAREHQIRVLVIEAGDRWDVVGIFGVAEYLAPVLMVWDDVDLFMIDRDEGNNSTLMHKLLTQLDGTTRHHGYALVAATNRLNVIEDALKSRPGRFDRVVSIDPPDDDCMKSILVKNIGKHNIEDEDIDQAIKRIKKEKKLSGALIKEVAHSAIMNSSKRNSDTVILEDLTYALDNITLLKKSAMGFK